MTQSTVSPVSRKSHQGAAGYSGNAEVVFLKGIDNHIPNVSVIVDDENVLRVAHRSFDLVVSPKRTDVSRLPVLIVTSLRRCVGNVHYRIRGQLAFTRMFWEGERQRVPGPADSIRRRRHEAPPIKYRLAVGRAQSNGTFQLLAAFVTAGLWTPSISASRF
jgi:hypothetical protein